MSWYGNPFTTGGLHLSRHAKTFITYMGTTAAAAIASSLRGAAARVREAKQKRDLVYLKSHYGTGLNNDMTSSKEVTHARGLSSPAIILVLIIFSSESSRSVRT